MTLDNMRDSYWGSASMCAGDPSKARCHNYDAANLVNMVIRSLHHRPRLFPGVDRLRSRDQARTRSKLQQIADDAAISGVLALASNTQRGAYVAQHEATVAVTNQIERKIDRAGILVRPSSADSAVSVEVSAPLQSPLQALLHNGKPVTVIGAANYLPPAQPQEVLANRLRGWRTYAQSKQD
jgi:hypothetical protein